MSTIGGRRAPSYGIDGPNALAGLTGSAVLAAAVTGGLRRAGLRVPALVAGLGAATAGTLATSMLAYSLLGKTALRDILLDEVPWRGDETVLDIGTGAGLMLIGAAARTRGALLGVDIWTRRDLTGNGAGRAVENAHRADVTVALAHGDAQRLPVRDGAVDVVLSVLCLHNVPSPAQSCHEIRRVLAPGGRVVIADYEGTAAYARTFAEAGLTVRTSRAPLHRTFGPMGIVVAHA